MRTSKTIGGLLLVIALSSACTSDPLPDVTSDSTTPPTTEDLGADRENGGAPSDATVASLVGTTWEFLEAFNVAPAQHVDGLTFYRIDGENRLEFTSSCGNAVATFVEMPTTIRVDRPVQLAGNTCRQYDVFFEGDLETDIDPLGRLTVRNRGNQADQLMRFAHVQSTSIQTDEAPERSSGQDMALRIGRSRWNVVEAEGVAISVDGLEQLITFTSTASSADVLSFFTGCRGVNKEVEWQDDASILIGAPFEFATVGMEGEPCLDARQGIADAFLISGTVLMAELLDDDTLQLSGVSREEAWSVVASRENLDRPPLPADCLDLAVGAVLDNTFSPTEVLPDGTQTTVTLNGFDVVSFERIFSDVDMDGERNPVQFFTLRDRSSDVEVDVIHVCGLDDPIDDFVRIHPNRIVNVSRSMSEGETYIWSSDGTQYSQNLHSILDGPWAIIEGTSYDLDDPDYLGPVTVTNKPLSADEGGDLVNGVLRLRWGCISITSTAGGGLVFPAGRTTFDPVNEAVIVDGVRYVDGERIAIRRVPRPEFLEYFNPMERERCGIDNHVVAEIWHL